ncbi:GNAT family acetyltransferase [Glutamicibacter bergerei]|jgi:ribosomal protein S18 acetylase RimI-like enzyme|uniref:GNAT family acetyltransferase n=2 Tax=Glutamicibacter TaxID=1742989 RepID=A0ABV9MTK3_9MICC|nr:MULTISPECIES: GNAT family acetyltransferase [Glutamicibacter]PCC33333.1 GNAT family acetyltransferase [Glutamicibacter sp. BW77]GGJ55439.1 GNAT family acetyltransferase [Glutamicibacter ardleyensis]HBV08856.1 GNAT family acetyltransferase [Micrococcaceae bacterium]
MQISELKLTEIGEATALWRSVELTRPWNDPEADARKTLENQSSTILAGRHEQRLVATAMVGFDGHRGWLYYVAVQPGMQGQGFGQEIMGAASRWLAEQGVPKVQLMVRTENTDVIGFYERLGYEAQEVVVLGKRLG